MPSAMPALFRKISFPDLQWHLIFEIEYEFFSSNMDNIFSHVLQRPTSRWQFMHVLLGDRECLFTKILKTVNQKWLNLQVFLVRNYLFFWIILITPGMIILREKYCNFQKKFTFFVSIS